MVTFPGLGIELNINKIAISILGIDIYWYAILIVLAIIMAFVVLKLQKNTYLESIIDLSIYLIPISIICARMYYVLFNLEYYIKNPVEIINIKSGGLAIYGGIIGGAIVTYIYCKIKKIDFIKLLDNIVPVLALRTSNRKMGQFCKYRSLWNRNK